MNPTYKDGQIVTTTAFINKKECCKRGDVIIFWGKEKKELLIKRVIGLPGEKITLGLEGIFINGNRYTDAFTQYMNYEETQIFQLEEDEYFVMGDNRNSSYDSRIFGGINTRMIISKVNQGAKEFECSLHSD